jgi:hypothetical protein
MTIPLLAKEFSRILQEWFMPALLKQAIARNETAEYKGLARLTTFVTRTWLWTTPLRILA